MDDTIYAPGPIKCRECGTELETIEKGYLQSQNCTGEIEDVEDYRAKYPDALTRTTEMRDKIINAIK
ncbi:hypothetical protein [Natrarchaeobaculum sulfurireducens]|uniref:Uncharacterized protein n=1 Tax=Natrarchaeobaculum sulfurireducens TaxID=2044521 RepID=A0A346P9I8_9EURY|nr:hypothetical protein [Natrarchaeobaculum sulfurireducens]AXR76183.1 hypothetical protein AArc1_4066 [Natrarchaeobaculum sulfurireducens]